MSGSAQKGNGSDSLVKKKQRLSRSLPTCALADRTGGGGRERAAVA